MVVFCQLGPPFSQSLECRLQGIEASDGILQPLLALARVHVACGCCFEQFQCSGSLQRFNALLLDLHREAFLHEQIGECVVAIPGPTVLMQLMPQAQHQQLGAAAHGFGADHRGPCR